MIETTHSESLYKLRRAAVRNDLRWRRLLDHMNIVDTTDDEIDEALDTD